MNAFIKGIIYEKYPGFVIIESNNMGYSITISMNTFNKLPIKGESVVLYTFLSIKNEEINIYGFINQKERALFLQLIQIPKIGPKTALSVFNTLTPEEFEIAIQNSDNRVLSSVKGISRKTADRIILEMSGKIEFDRASVSGDAFDALIVLGFKAKEIEKVLRDIVKTNRELSTEELIKEALKRLR